MSPWSIKSVYQSKSSWEWNSVVWNPSFWSILNHPDPDCLHRLDCKFWHTTLPVMCAQSGSHCVEFLRIAAELMTCGSHVNSFLWCTHWPQNTTKAPRIVNSESYLKRILVQHFTCSIARFVLEDGFWTTFSTDNSVELDHESELCRLYDCLPECLRTPGCLVSY